MAKAVLASLRITRLLGPLSSDRFQKSCLSVQMMRPEFSLQQTDKEDIMSDLGKALENLHNLGITHGSVNEDHVIIDEVVVCLGKSDELLQINPTKHTHPSV